MRYITWAPWLLTSRSHELVARAFVMKTILVLVLLGGYFCIIASKFHYTCDVLIGSMVSFLTYGLYHSTLRVAFLPSLQPPLLKCSIYPFIRWFDKHAVDVIVLKTMLRRPQEHCVGSSIVRPADANC